MEKWRILWLAAFVSFLGISVVPRAYGLSLSVGEDQTIVLETEGKRYSLENNFLKVGDFSLSFLTACKGSKEGKDKYLSAEGVKVKRVVSDSPEKKEVEVTFSLKGYNTKRPYPESSLKLILMVKKGSPLLFVQSSFSNQVEDIKRDELIGSGYFHFWVTTDKFREYSAKNIPKKEMLSQWTTFGTGDSWYLFFPYEKEKKGLGIITKERVFSNNLNQVFVSSTSLLPLLPKGTEHFFSFAVGIFEDEKELEEIYSKKKGGLAINYKKRIPELRKEDISFYDFSQWSKGEISDLIGGNNLKIGEGDVFGKKGSVVFGEKGGCIISKDLKEIKMPEDALTIEAWVKPAEKFPANGYIVANSFERPVDDKAAYGLYLKGSGYGDVAFIVNNSEYLFNSLRFPSQGERWKEKWYHIIGTWKPGKVGIYINGRGEEFEQVEQGKSEPVETPLKRIFRIGARGVGKGEKGYAWPFKGEIAQVRISNLWTTPEIALSLFEGEKDFYFISDIKDSSLVVSLNPEILDPQITELKIKLRNSSGEVIREKRFKSMELNRDRTIVEDINSLLVDTYFLETEFLNYSGQKVSEEMEVKQLGSTDTLEKEILKLVDNFQKKYGVDKYVEKEIKDMFEKVGKAKEGEGIKRAKDYLDSGLNYLRMLDNEESYRYFKDIEKFLEKNSLPENKKYLVNIGDLGVQDVEKAKSLGATTTWTWSRALHPSLAEKIKESGLEIVLARDNPSDAGLEWWSENEKYALRRYLITPSVKAEERKPLEIKLLDFFLVPVGFFLFRPEPPSFQLCSETEESIIVLNSTTQKNLSNKEFEYKEGRVIINNPIPNNEYKVIFMVKGGIHPPGGDYSVDIAFPEVREYLVKKFEEAIASQRVDYVRPIGTGYPYSVMRIKDREGKCIDWLFTWYTGYMYGTSPFSQRLFEEKKGIKFNPLWLVNDGKYGRVDFPPPLEYLQWMDFQEEIVEEFTSSLVNVSNKYGIKLRPFWGDYSIGMSPYQGVLERAGVPEVEKSCSNPTVIRLLMDAPFSGKKIIRFSPWLGRYEPPRYLLPPYKDKAYEYMIPVLEDRLSDIFRGMLFKVTDGLSFGGDISWAEDRYDVKEEIRRAILRYKLFYNLLSGRKAFTHPINIYVLNSWGKRASWPIVDSVFPSVTVLGNLVDMPVNVKFLSLLEIEKNGIPSDCDVLLNCGEAGSSYSGGYMWGFSSVVEKIEKFVREGGGFIGIGDPSHFEKNGLTWQLSNLLGLEYWKKADSKKGRLDNFSTVWTELPQGRMEKSSISHFVGENLPQELNFVLCDSLAKPIGEDLKIIYQFRGSPGVVVREYGKGRVGYICGYSGTEEKIEKEEFLYPSTYDVSCDYYRLLKRMIFWTAGKENLLEKLHTETNGIFLYLYPEIDLLAIYNYSPQEVKANIQFDVSLLGKKIEKKYSLKEVVEKKILSFRGDELKRGVSLKIPPRRVKFFKIS